MNVSMPGQRLRIAIGKGFGWKFAADSKMSVGPANLVSMAVHPHGTGHQGGVKLGKEYNNDVDGSDHSLSTPLTR